ncbi:uncharacterized protein K489DRAFT_377405 [Dissoconium aciculare CBS 342.82]|uniref:Uncharacterized protein n=1 Tax=Dissoconium aciculare CBS 342.82 TaxID=1314786 RepID=A0A6J3MA11_9PEZI|nr:uncharacterized protein K489DRAFT_377405 [Dissoconium aciculare CBS 342.82]KAF1824870.1 hypothetical protein K489DRAFT_377405 [Dissoconium aciculare CBS 342.82]
MEHVCDEQPLDGARGGSSVAAFPRQLPQHERPPARPSTARTTENPPVSSIAKQLPSRHRACA